LVQAVRVLLTDKMANKKKLKFFVIALDSVLG